MTRLPWSLPQNSKEAACADFASESAAAFTFMESKVENYGKETVPTRTSGHGGRLWWATTRDRSRGKSIRSSPSPPFVEVGSVWPLGLVAQAGGEAAVDLDERSEVLRARLRHQRKRFAHHEG